MISVRYAGLWQDLLLRVNTVRLKAILGGDKRVYLEGENYGTPEGALDKPWGRVILVPGYNPFGTEAREFQPIAFLTRVEFNRFEQAGYNVQVQLDAAHDELFQRLHGYVVPIIAGQIMGARPIHKARDPHPHPQWEEARGLFWTSAEYRFEVTLPA